MYLGSQYKCVEKLSYHANSSDIKCVPILNREGEGLALAHMVTSSWKTLTREGGVCLSQVFLMFGNWVELYLSFQLMSILPWNLVT